MMTAEHLRALQAQILADPACAPYVVTNAMPKDPDYRTKDTAIAEILSEGRTKLVERWIDERGVVSNLGTEHGDAFLTALEGIENLELSPPHPLAAHKGGVTRMVAWLKSAAGINLGDEKTQDLLSTLASLGVLDPTHTELICSLARTHDPVSAAEVSRALRGPWGDEE